VAYCYQCARCLSVSLSRESTRLRCAKLAEQIKMLFVVNTPVGPWNIVLHVTSFKFCDRLHIPGTATATVSCACSVCCAKLLWHLVILRTESILLTVFAGQLCLLLVCTAVEFIAVSINVHCIFIRTILVAYLII